MTSQQATGTATYSQSTPQMQQMQMQMAKGGAAAAAPAKTSFINHENTLGEFKFRVGPPVADPKQELLPRLVHTTAEDPVTGNTEDWLGVNFRSCYDDAGMSKLGRPPIELVLVLDISGSMSCGFEEGYGWGCDPSKSKLGVAKRCINAILAQLTPDDSVGIVLFNQESHTLLPLTPCGSLNRAEVAAKVDGIHTSGGTKLSQGFNSGVQMLAASVAAASKKSGTKTKGKAAKGASSKAAKSAAAAAAADDDDDEAPIVGRRVMFLTDMESGVHDEEQVLAIANQHASPIGGCHTTVIGIGVDVSVGTVQALSKIPGCKYLSVSSASEFEESVASEFPYDVTPIAFNIEVELTCGRTFSKGFGTSELNAMESGVSSFQLSSEFPVLSTPVTMEASGALYLFKLDPKAPDSKGIAATLGAGLWNAASALVGGSGGGGGGSSSGAAAASSSSAADMLPLTAKTSWTNRAGKKVEMEQTVLPASATAATDKFAVRKGIALTRYVDLQAEYVLEDDELARDFGKQTAAALASKKAKHNGWVQRFEEFKAWFVAELAACDDKTVEAGGSNVNIMDTINQIIELEKKEAADVEAKEAAAAAVTAVADGKVKLPASKDTPHEYLCPITSELMVDPVIAVDGQTYERAAITTWFKNHGKGATVLSPMTNKPLKSRNLVPNLSLRKLIQDHVKRTPPASAGADDTKQPRRNSRRRNSFSGSSASKRAKQSAK